MNLHADLAQNRITTPRVNSQTKSHSNPLRPYQPSNKNSDENTTSLLEVKLNEMSTFISHRILNIS